MEEIIFIVKDNDERGFTASALEFSIFTETDTFEELKDAVSCHFEDEQKSLIRLHYVKEEVFAWRRFHETLVQMSWSNGYTDSTNTIQQDKQEATTV